MTEKKYVLPGEKRTLSVAESFIKKREKEFNAINMSGDSRELFRNAFDEMADREVDPETLVAIVTLAQLEMSYGEDHERRLEDLRSLIGGLVEDEAFKERTLALVTHVEAVDMLVSEYLDPWNQLDLEEFVVRDERLLEEEEG